MAVHSPRCPGDELEGGERSGGSVVDGEMDPDLFTSQLNAIVIKRVVGQLFIKRPQQQPHHSALEGHSDHNMEGTHTPALVTHLAGTGSEEHLKSTREKKLVTI
ncbi:hypothetical protein EYF80_044067 [Liparis tanakae]|uniref:Uncharacterized protein n=1 Tax=Liparis tanakae TaxID=230148 RepID=A0A4Z2FWS1_9TELE|nr:hypothetical protein EYF80_044067 [Liparis tanakae]